MKPTRLLRYEHKEGKVTLCTSVISDIKYVSNAVVATVQLSFEISFFSHVGRYLKNSVDEEKRVNPVSLGEDVAPWNS
jgi:hypothetical protein